jgi:hypothetical protein
MVEPHAAREARVGAEANRFCFARRETLQKRENPA